MQHETRLHVTCPPGRQLVALNSDDPNFCVSQSPVHVICDIRQPKQTFAPKTLGSSTHIAIMFGG